MKSTICTTRKQLIGYGATSYQAKIVTENLKPISKSNQTNIYSLGEVIGSMEEYLQRPKINKQTQQSLITLLSVLINQLNNFVPANFNLQSKNITISSRREVC